MEWEFRKTLSNFETYKANHSRFEAEVNKGTPGVLNTLVREIEIIIADPNELPLSKVLAIRFSVSLMILGRTDVVNQLKKLVPHMVKVCSYRHDEESPNRGETYFNNHPEYEKAKTEQQRVQIQTYASTYFTLCLQSILHWAKWIPVDENGSESIYSKGYNSLLERGVKFQSYFNYYKIADTERFKNTYRVEFFTESSLDMNSKSGDLNSSQVSIASHEYYDIEKIKNSLFSLEASKKQRFDKLEELNRAVSSMHETRFPARSNTVYQGKDKADKKWLENYMINYNLLMAMRINYEDFINRVTVEDVELPMQEQIELIQSQKISNQDYGLSSYKKTKVSAKRQTAGKVERPDPASDRLKYEQMLRKQEQAFNRKRESYKADLSDRDSQIKNMKRQHEEEKGEMIKMYESRIELIKHGIVDSSAEKTQQLVKENEKLRGRVNQLETSFMNKELYSDRQKQLEMERDHLRMALQHLRIENEKLKNNFEMGDQNGQLIRRVKELQRELEQTESRSKVGAQLSDPSPDIIAKKDKQIKNLSEQMKLYKNELASEREKFDKKMLSMDEKMESALRNNRELKAKIEHFQKKMDLKDIETAELVEQIKLFKMMSQQEPIALKTQNLDYVANPNRTIANSDAKSNGVTPGKSVLKTHSFKFKKYENLRNSFKIEKQRYLRFVRCCLKKKDLLIKENELEVGIIGELIAEDEMKFTFFFTNMAEQQITDLELQLDAPDFIEASLNAISIFCIQSQEQEKVGLHCKSRVAMESQTVYEPIRMTITYTKNSKPFCTKVTVPFVLFKQMEFYKPQPNPKLFTKYEQMMDCYFCKKIIPDYRSLATYFPNIEETYRNKFQCEVFHRGTKLRANMCFQFSNTQFLIVRICPILGNEGNNISGAQRLVMDDLMSFLEFCLRK